MQRPPAYSALKVGGKRACDMARDGRPVPLAERPVRIDAIELLSFDPPDIRLRIDCGRARIFARSPAIWGSHSTGGGYLTQLCRTRVGRFSIDNAIALDQPHARGD